MVNKSDLLDQWEVGEESVKPFTDRNIPVYRSSAKTGENVDEAFARLARAILGS